jgi:hypothetical protein
MARLDIDPRNGGCESWQALIDKYGPLPETPLVRTGGGGWQYLLSFPPGTKSRTGVLPGIDLKADGGQVIVPPSRVYCDWHTAPYSWEVKPWYVPVIPAPGWCIRLFAPAKLIVPGCASDFTVEDADSLLTHPGSPKGERRETFLRLAGSMIGRGDSFGTVETAAEQWAGRCDPPFEHWRKHLNGLWAKEVAKADSVPTNTSRPVSLVVSDGSKPTLALDILPPQSHGDWMARATVTGPDTLPSVPVVHDEVMSIEVEGCGPHRPVLAADAYHGLLGDYVLNVRHLTEADPAGILSCLLAGVGVHLGRGVHHRFGKQHSANLFVLLVGSTGSRKGTCWSVANALLGLAGPAVPFSGGLGSGQGLVHRVRDSKGDDPGEADKRLLVVEEEFGKVLRLCRANDGILSPVLRTAFDGQPLSVMNKGENAYECREPHVGMIGMITAEELADQLKGRTEIANGLLNRYLLVGVRRNGYLPEGGDYYSVASAHAPNLAAALIRAGKLVGPWKLAPEASAVWSAHYHRLEAERPGVYGQATARLSVHTLKLAVVYAAIDGTTEISPSHLAAALAVVEYGRQTAEQIFGTGSADIQPVVVEPDPAWMRVLGDIEKFPGIMRSELLRTTRLKADMLTAELGMLEVKGKVYKLIVPSGGRDAERWYRTTANNPPLPPSNSSQAVDGEKEVSGLPTAILPAPKPVGDQSQLGEQAAQDTITDQLEPSSPAASPEAADDLTPEEAADPLLRQLLGLPALPGQVYIEVKPLNSGSLPPPPPPAADQELDDAFYRRLMGE